MKKKFIYVVVAAFVVSLCTSCVPKIEYRDAIENFTYVISESKGVKKWGLVANLDMLPEHHEQVVPTECDSIY